MTQSSLFFDQLSGQAREAAQRSVRLHHYSHSVPSGKSYWFALGDAVVCISLPANKNIGRFLLGRHTPCWELARLWAPDGHAANLLTQAISSAVDSFSKMQPSCEVLVSYADPNQQHHGGIYRAASWIFTGISEESRYYLDATGQTVARRKFHSGRGFLKKAEIEALGYIEAKRPGKARFARGLTRQARTILEGRFLASDAVQRREATICTVASTNHNDPRTTAGDVPVFRRKC